MLLQVLLIISAILMLVASVVAISLVKQTKYNSVWILIICALVCLMLLAVLQFVIFLKMPPEIIIPDWAKAITSLSLIVSICLSIGVLYARKLVFYIDRINFQRQLTSKRILSTVLRTEEKERIRFSKELHDGLGPLLSSAKMSLSVVDKSTLSESDREVVKNTYFVIDEAIRSLREISNNLSPHVLNEFGLAKGISNFVSKVSAMNKLPITFKSDTAEKRFDTDIEVILYRIVCELINNSLRHAECSHIELSLNLDHDTLSLTYADNGKGFSPAVAPTGMGLANISSRVSSLNGTFDLKSAPGKGMSATVTVKLKDR